MTLTHNKQLSDVPEGEISDVCILPVSGQDESLVAVASWTDSVNLYDFKRNVRVGNYSTKMPVLSISALVSQVMFC